MRFKSILVLFGWAALACTALAGCDDSGGRHVGMAVRAQSAVASAFAELSAAPDVRSALVVATAPKFGVRQIKGQLPGVAPETLVATPLRAASIGKIFTATVILQLLEEGRLRVDQPLGELLSDADMPDGFSLAQLHAASGALRGERITVRQLLNHTSGLADIFFDNASAAPSSMSFSERYILNILGVLPEGLETRQWQGGRELLGYYFAQRYHEIPAGEPGATFHYSDTNYFLLGLIAERASRQTLAQLYRSRIFDRLGLHQAVLEWYEPRRAAPMPHYLNLQAIVAGAGLELPQPLPPQLVNADMVALGFNTSFDWAGGGVLLSANDLDVFLRALLSGKLFQQPATLALMQESVAVPETNAAYGLGLMRREVEAVVCYGHGGAWGVEAWHCPSRDLTLVFATNQFVRDAAPGAEQLLARLLPILQ